MPTSIIVARFASSDFRLPKRHFYSCCKALASLNRELVVVQAVLPGQDPLVVPEPSKSVVVQIETVMFRKENLWNYGANAATGDKLFFVDSDVLLSPPQWIEDAEAVLDEFDVTQPFSGCVWLGADGKPTQSRSSVASALASGCRMSFDDHHPGFAWGMTRGAFDRLGGFYDRDVSGGGDAALMLALASDKQLSFFKGANQSLLSDPTWVAYRQRARAAKIRVGEHPGACARHLWHGTRGGRLYRKRGDIQPRRADGSSALRERPDGILEWEDMRGDAALRSYLAGRREDGGEPMLVLLGSHIPDGLVKTVLESTMDVREDVDSVATDNHLSGRMLLEDIVDADAIAGSFVSGKFPEIAEQYPGVKFVILPESPDELAIGAVKLGIRVNYEDALAAAVNLIDSALERFIHEPERLLVISPEWGRAEFEREMSAFLSRPVSKISSAESTRQAAITA